MMFFVGWLQDRDQTRFFFFSHAAIAPSHVRHEPHTLQFVCVILAFKCKMHTCQTGQPLSFEVRGHLATRIELSLSALMTFPLISLDKGTLRKNAKTLEAVVATLAFHSSDWTYRCSANFFCCLQSCQCKERGYHH